jgi:probable F420-dependent oxidoreductase
MRPFRFGVQLSALPAADWRERARRIEALGYSTVFWPDHFGAQWDPTVALTAVAGATQRLRVGTLVYGIDYRHPVVLAKQAATLQIVSGGRHEFGLGAGWMETDYVEAGLPYDRPGVRIERLDEALSIVRSMWANEKTTFAGRHYTLRDVARAAPLAPGEAPLVLVGGGGPRVLRVAGRHADIVGVNPMLPEGRVTSTTAADLAPERIARKLDWIREGAEAAGRDFAAIELNALVFVVALTDDPRGIRSALAGNTGMTPEQIADCPLFLTGPPSEVVDRLAKRREETGISYVVVQGRDVEVLERFAEGVVAPLAGR